VVAVGMAIVNPES